MGAVPNLFSRVHERGFNVGVAGWFFPYCDEFRASLAWCAAWERSTDRNSMGGGVFEIMRSQAKIALEAEFRSPFGQLLAASAHARVYRQWDPAAEKAVSDAGLSLVFVHAPIPHEPFFYDRSTGRDDLWDTFRGGLAGLKYDRFLDALELMDRTFGGFRRAMERSGTWETSAVIATSDHPYAMRERVDGRPLNPRVPFLVKLPGQHEGLRYAGHFETAHTGDLILAILNGEIARSEDLVRWMDARGARAAGAGSR
jgi:arylsulfatase A-like enzyme